MNRIIVNNCMVGAAKRVMMCRPTNYNVTYSINPWTDVTNQVNKKTAHKQWEMLRETIENCGARVEVMESNETNAYPDIVFCANAGIVRGKNVYLSHFVHDERVGEHAFYQKFFESLGFRTRYNLKSKHEGAGDALWCGTGMNTLISAFGQRSEFEACKDIKKLLKTSKKDKFSVVPARLVDPRFYHLDTCFCPLDENLALIYPGAFDEKSYEAMKKKTEVLPISEKDAKKFACNAVIIGKNVIVNKGADETFKLLENHGFEVHPIDMSEFIKAGGSAKCCTLRLE